MDANGNGSAADGDIDDNVDDVHNDGDDYNNTDDNVMMWLW